ncbi:MAG: hypothetical protein D6811_06645 [Alphaproteobacteria bacterium]|nr:MAG: hypothetical protein D6811_06645 [Alphaproteobacteria bacterium]
MYDERLATLAILADMGNADYRGVEIERARDYGWTLTDGQSGRVTFAADALCALHLVDMLRDHGAEEWFSPPEAEEAA